jgi:predicted RNase H-like HicB family nuclease
MMPISYWARTENLGGGGYHIFFPDVPEAITQSPSWAEVYDRAHDALAAALEGYLERAAAKPVARSVMQGQAGMIVSVAPAVRLAFALQEEMVRAPLSDQELADQLGCRVSTIRRMLRGDRHLTNLAVRALRVLGGQAALTF